MLEAFGLSDAGCVRSNNEDYFISDSKLGIFILADGMGGANAGEYASRLSAEKVYELLRNSPNGGLEVLERTFAEANRSVREAARGNPELDGMGTTLLALRANRDGDVQVASVGDSRAYLWSNRELTLITHDQTWVNEVGSRLGLTDEALRKHPMRHVLTMAVGTMDDLRVDTKMVHLNSGDQVLLCSDGLHGVIDEKMLHHALDSEKSLPEKCHYLIDAARKMGGPDNITVVLVQLV